MPDNKKDKDKMQQNVYTDLIPQDDYVQTVWNQHIYIRQVNDQVFKLVKQRAEERAQLNLVELGCGPGLMLPRFAGIEGVRVSALDLDDKFLQYAHQLCQGVNVNFIQTDLTQPFELNAPVDVFYSSGFHHHVNKPEGVRCYLQQVAQHLSEQGCYLLVDEFIPHYTDENMREVLLVVWYAHVIAHALKSGHELLAREEAKTLLDDLVICREGQHYKQPQQIDLILQTVESINQQAESGNIQDARQQATEILSVLMAGFSKTGSGRRDMDLSRCDYKICQSALEQELGQVGLAIQEYHHFGPVDTIGALSLYVIGKIL